MDRPAFYLWSLSDAWGWLVNLPVIGAVTSIIVALALWIIIGGAIENRNNY